MFYGLAPTDPGTIGTATAVTLGLAVLAGWLPSRRADGLEALIALRQD